jgi:hypothetical protein
MAHVKIRKTARIALPSVLLMCGLLLVSATPALGSAHTSSQRPLIGGGTPANQPALDAAANAAQRIAGSKYFTSAVVSDPANTVTLHLVHAPESVIRRLNASHPRIYVIDNTAAYSYAHLNALMNRINDDFRAFSSEGVSVQQIGPTTDGYLKAHIALPARVTKTNSRAAKRVLGAAGVILDSLYGRGPFKVTAATGLSPKPISCYRYSDCLPTGPSAGDFIYHKTSSTNWADCTGAFPVTKGGVEYMLTAAHCFLSWGVGLPIYNGYVRQDTNNVFGSQAEVGVVRLENQKSSSIANDDSALIQSSEDYASFAGPWNSTYGLGLAGVIQNHVGDKVCTSGAFEGNVCGDLTVRSVSQTYTFDGNLTKNVTYATSASGTQVAGEGDSGGPVYNFVTNSTGLQLQARGVMDAISGGSSCNNEPTGELDRSCAPNIYYIGLNSLLNDWGATLG